MLNLATDYLGLQLKSPLVASSGPHTSTLDAIRLLEDAGIAAVVLPSVFEEQILLESRALDRDLNRGTDSNPEASGYLPDYKDFRTQQDATLELLAQARRAVKIPVIASLNGATAGGWLRFARELEQAGASAIELNTYQLPVSNHLSGETIEESLIDLVYQVKQNASVPVAVKLSPQFTSIPHLARHLDTAGADALILFNRFYQPDFDVEGLKAVPRLTLSTSDELLLRLHWTAILFGNLRAQIAITGGVHTAADVLKSIMAGAQVTMMASALLQNGPKHLATVYSDLLRWMDEHGYAEIVQMRGSLSRQSVPDSSPFERGNYIKTLSQYTLRK
jgi:dihydroorotate dehydrogenase (fumarate)